MLLLWHSVTELLFTTDITLKAKYCSYSGILILINIPGECNDSNMYSHFEMRKNGRSNYISTDQIHFFTFGKLSKLECSMTI